MRRFLLLTKASMLMNLRNRVTLFWNVAFPIGLVLLYGLIWREQIAWIAIGIVVLNIMSSGMLGDAAQLSNLRERGILRRVHATPLPAWQFITAYVLTRLVLVLIQSALIILTGILAYGARFTWAGLALALPCILVGSLVFLLLGQVISAVAPNSSAAGAIGQAIYFPLMFVSNLFLPLDLLPHWLSRVSIWTPATMLVDLIRPMLLPIPAVQSALVNGVGLFLYGGVALVLAAKLFRWEQ